MTIYSIIGYLSIAIYRILQNLPKNEVDKMPLITKIRELCKFNGISVTKLEVALGYGNGSITKHSTLRSDRIQEIAKYFNVTPTYLLTDMKFCVCPVCGVAYDPLDTSVIKMHIQSHYNYIVLRDKIGYLLNPSEASTKRAIAMQHLEQNDIPDEGKIFHYETLMQCDFAEYAYFNDFVIDISYSDFIKEKIKERKYFNLLPQTVIKNITVKYNVEVNNNETPLIELFQNDKEFMTNITDLWDLPQQLRYDVYKAIRHAKRDYADKEYYTNPYANLNKCQKYDPNNEKCKDCNMTDIQRC